MLSVEELMFFDYLERQEQENKKESEFDGGEDTPPALDNIDIYKYI